MTTNHKKFLRALSIKRNYFNYILQIISIYIFTFHFDFNFQHPRVSDGSTPVCLLKTLMNGWFDATGSDGNSEIDQHLPGLSILNSSKGSSELRKSTRPNSILRSQLGSVPQLHHQSSLWSPTERKKRKKAPPTLPRREYFYQSRKCPRRRLLQWSQASTLISLKIRSRPPSRYQRWNIKY